ncbi:MAG: thioredoxin family protein [Bacillota bacterium]
MDLKKYWKIAILALFILAVPLLYAWKQRADYARMDREAERLLREEKRGNLVAPGEDGLPMLLDLGAGTCVPCRQMQPILEALRKEYEGRITVQIVDVYEHPDWARRYGIYLIPTQIFFDAEGKELFRHEGFFSRQEILGKFKEFGWIKEETSNG